MYIQNKDFERFENFNKFYPIKQQVTMRMNKWLTVNETARILGISASTLRRLEENNVVKQYGFRVYYTPGGQRRYSSDEVKAMYLERGFSGSFGFGNKPAIIVRDIVKAFSNPISKLGYELDSVIAALTQLLEKARMHKIPVFMIISEYDENLDASKLWATKISGIHYLLRSSDWTDIDTRFADYPYENINYTPYISSFFQSPLDNRLQTLEVDTVILAGCSTSGCIRATAIDAVQYGYKTIVAKEAVGDRLERVHQANLEDLEAKFADVISVERLLQYFETLQDASRKEVNQG